MKEALKSSAKDLGYIWAEGDRRFIFVNALTREKTKLLEGITKDGTTQQRGLEENQAIVNKEEVG